MTTELTKIEDNEKIQELEGKSNAIMKIAQSTKVTSWREVGEAADIALSWQQEVKTIKEKMDPIVDAAYKAYKLPYNMRKEMTEKIMRGQSILTTKIKAFKLADRKEREEKARIAEEKARREEERIRAEKERQAKNWEEKGKPEKCKGS